MQKALGVALDIGTTTIQGKLIDLEQRKELSYFSCLNEQLTFGHDIINRIKFSLEKKNGLEKLHRRAISSINFIIEKLLSASGRNKEDISFIAAVGNTVSYHFVLSLSPKKLVEPPYQPEYKDFQSKKAEELGIKTNKDCEFNFLPNVGGFVGSDAIAVILATDLDESESPALAVDIGTNGEIILGSKEKILVASTAAGPAFEGWHMSCGMRAVQGAIESVEDKEGKISFKVMGDGEPVGISGSGLIDIIAILLKKGQVDSSGRMKGDFVIYPVRNGISNGVYDKDKRIYVSQSDVRQVQLAKASFSVGMGFLRRLSKNDIAKFFITGNFGHYLNKDNAKIVGIVPKDIEVKSVKSLENGALKGVEIFINNKDTMMPRIKNILGKTEHISLNQDKNFQREFTEAMKF